MDNKSSLQGQIGSTDEPCRWIEVKISFKDVYNLKEIIAWCNEVTGNDGFSGVYDLLDGTFTASFKSIEIATEFRLRYG